MGSTTTISSTPTTNGMHRKPAAQISPLAWSQAAPRRLAPNAHRTPTNRDSLRPLIPPPAQRSVPPKGRVSNARPTLTTRATLRFRTPVLKPRVRLAAPRSRRLVHLLAPKSLLARKSASPEDRVSNAHPTSTTRATSRSRTPVLIPRARPRATSDLRPRPTNDRRPRAIKAPLPYQDSPAMEVRMSPSTMLTNSVIKRSQPLAKGKSSRRPALRTRNSSRGLGSRLNSTSRRHQVACAPPIDSLAATPALVTRWLDSTRTSPRRRTLPFAAVA